MTNYRSGEFVLVDFPFSGGGSGKRRPAPVVADVGDNDVLVARVTTQAARTPLDVPITNWQGSGLLAASVVRLHKLATLEKSLISRRLGIVAKVDRDSLASSLQLLLHEWVDSDA